MSERPPRPTRPRRAGSGRLRAAGDPATALAERAIGRPRRLARRALLAADAVFQLERLYAFNRKFFPEWRPRYVCVERLSDLPLVGFAYLRAQSLLVPPGPWVRRERGIADASV